MTAPVQAREITAALKLLYPHARLSTSEQEDGTFLVRMPAASARYWGAERDPQYAAAWVTRSLPRAVEIRSVRPDTQAGGGTALVTLAVAGPDQPRPADPGLGRGIPVYQTVDDVIGDFPATRPVRNMIQAAVDGGLRPHLLPTRSPHGPRYRVQLQGLTIPHLLGTLDISDTKGQFADAWLIKGSGPERRYHRNEAGLVRKEIYAARDQYQAETVSRGSVTAHLPAGRTGPATARQRPSGTTRQARPRGPR